MSLLPFEIRLAELWPPDEWRDLTVLLAVSGGADSIALLRAMAALKTTGRGRLFAAHFNHNLRVEADNDQQFVMDLCQRLGVECKTGCGNIKQMAKEANEGIELTARRARHHFLQKTAGEVGARFVVTAHTADDQAETILHRIVRGTGIAGLAGIPRSRRFGHATLLRPMLDVRRREIVRYLRDIGQPFREDPSNADRRFTRNRIRHELLPLLAEKYNSAAADALLRLGGLAAEVQEVVDKLIEQLFEQAVKSENSTAVEIDAAVLADQPRYLSRELLVAIWRRQAWPLRAMGFVQWDQLAEMLSKPDRTSPSAVIKQIFPGNVQAEIRDARLRLVRIE